MEQLLSTPLFMIPYLACLGAYLMAARTLYRHLFL